MQWFLMVMMSASVFGQSETVSNWPQWRGPARDGIVAQSSVPKVWPAKLQRAWRVEVGEGYSSPVVADKHVFVHSRQGTEELVTALNLDSGKVGWQQKYAAPFAKNSYAEKMAKGPYSTPLIANGHLFTLGGTGILSAWNTESGALVWRRDFSASVATSKLFCGTAMSPLMEGGALIVQVGSDVHGGQVLALDPATGKERWVWRGPGPGYASPIACTIAGVRQVVLMTQESVVGLDAKTGAALWSLPFPDEWQENIVTPVWTGAHLIVSGVRQGTHAYTLKQNGEKWEASRAWTNTDAPMYMSSPVFADGTLYGHSSKKRGHFVALDAATGKVRWATEGRDGDQASVLLTPSHLIYLTNGANLVIARRATAKFEPIQHYEVAESETWAMPVLLSDGLLVRDAEGIARMEANK